MKQIFLLTSLLCSLGVSAQKWSVAVSSGAAVPAGDFAKGFYNTGTGWLVQGQASYSVFRDWGVTVLSGYQDNPYNGSYSNAYRFWRLMAGPSWRHALGKNWRLEARVLAGESRYPLSKADVKPFTWGGGLALQYKLGRHWFLQASEDFLASSANINGYVVTSSEIIPIAYRAHYNTVNTSAGLGYSF
jgi:hypothetical protein